MLGVSASVKDPNISLHMTRDRCAPGTSASSCQCLLQDHSFNSSGVRSLNVWLFEVQTFDASQQDCSQPEAAVAAVQQSPAFVHPDEPRRSSPPMPASAPQDGSVVAPDSPPRPQKYGRDTATGLCLFADLCSETECAVSGRSQGVCHGGAGGVHAVRRLRRGRKQLQPKSWRSRRRRRPGSAQSKRRPPKSKLLLCMDLMVSVVIYA